MISSQRDAGNDEKLHKPGHKHGTHVHAQSAVDPFLFATQRGISVVKLSFLGLMATALFQTVVVVFTGSVALLADTIHNFGDAITTIPLWIAFRLARWKPTQRFTYGYGRVEDLAGVVIILTILLSAIVAGYESFDRLSNPRAVVHLWAVVIASVIGFIGNEAVAIFRIKVGKEIGSIALVTDGYHARVDGLTSLAVLLGAGGIWLGYPLADPIVGIVITGAIIRIVWESGKAIFIRLLDGIDPEVIDEIREVVTHTPGVNDVTEVRVRWLGHRLHAEVNVAVSPDLSVEIGHSIAMAVEHHLLQSLQYLFNATIHVDPLNASGEEHHHIDGPLSIK